MHISTLRKKGEKVGIHTLEPEFIRMDREELVFNTTTHLCRQSQQINPVQHLFKHTWSVLNVYQHEHVNVCMRSNNKKVKKWKVKKKSMEWLNEEERDREEQIKSWREIRGLFDIFVVWKNSDQVGDWN